MGCIYGSDQKRAIIPKMEDAWGNHITAIDGGIVFTGDTSIGVK